MNNDSEIKEINLNNRIKYTNKEYDITIIEIKEEDNIKDYLELDENIIKEGINQLYINNPIYIIQYSEQKKLGVSYGILKGIFKEKEYNIKHSCFTEKGSSGSPIINLINNKVIGIHKKADNNNNYNIGLFLNYAIEDLINKKYIIKEWNERFNLNLKENDNIKELNLSMKRISDLKLLEKLNFENLKILDLSNNKISDIKALEKAKLKSLEILNLNDNKISKIKILEKVQFENLEILNLSHNIISDIQVLEKINLENLKELNLNHNKISDIQVFEKSKLDNLKKIIFKL